MYDSTSLCPVLPNSGSCKTNASELNPDRDDTRAQFVHLVDYRVGNVLLSVWISFMQTVTLTVEVKRKRGIVSLHCCTVPVILAAHGSDEHHFVITVNVVSCVERERKRILGISA